MIAVSQFCETAIISNPGRSFPHWPLSMLYCTNAFYIVCFVVHTNGKNSLKTYDIVFFVDLPPVYDKVCLMNNIVYDIVKLGKSRSMYSTIGSRMASQATPQGCRHKCVEVLFKLTTVQYSVFDIQYCILYCTYNVVHTISSKEKYELLIHSIYCILCRIWHYRWVLYTTLSWYNIMCYDMCNYQWCIDLFLRHISAFRAFCPNSSLRRRRGGTRLG
jgi:hypothetical protein